MFEMRKNMNVKTITVKFSCLQIITTTKALTSSTMIMTTNKSMQIQFTIQEIRGTRQLEVLQSRANSLSCPVLG